MDIIRRPVPDNQEMFVSPPSGDEGLEGTKPLSLFIDVLEAASDECPSMMHAPWFHARELLIRDERSAEAAALPPPCSKESDESGNGGYSNDDPRASAIEESGDASSQARVVALSPELMAGGGHGIVASVSVFYSCDLEVGVLRIPEHATDIVFSLHGRSRITLPASEREAVSGVSSRSEAVASTSMATCPPLRDLIATVAVVDWGLFGTEGGGEDAEERYLGS